MTLLTADPVDERDSHHVIMVLGVIFVVLR